MKRSEINAAVREAGAAFRRHGWTLPPEPRWDVTDFGLGDFGKWGLAVVNLAEEPEYCEKLMYCRKNQVTPRHHHRSKKEDIICRAGELAVELYAAERQKLTLKVNGQPRELPVGEPFVLKAGERITLTPEADHAFWAATDYAVLGEVSTANDDLHDNYFHDERIGRFSAIDEDEPAVVRLVSDG